MLMLDDVTAFTRNQITLQTLTARKSIFKLNMLVRILDGQVEDHRLVENTTTTNIEQYELHASLWAV